MTTILISRAERFPKTLFALSRTRSQGREVPDTCSPVHRCTPAVGMEKATVAAQAERRGKNLDWFRCMSVTDSPRSGSDPNPLKLLTRLSNRISFPEQQNKARLGELPANRGARARRDETSGRGERRRRRRSAHVALLFSLTYQVVEHSTL